MGVLSELPNIGSALEEQLKQAGITTCEQLKEMGSEQAWLRIRAFDPSACMNRLLALEGAVQGVKKSQLTEETKERLREFYRSFH